MFLHKTMLRPVANGLSPLPVNSGDTPVIFTLPPSPYTKIKVVTPNAST